MAGALRVFLTAISAVSTTIWCVLVLDRGRFWRLQPRFPRTVPVPPRWPSVAVIVPARNEAHVLPATLPTLLEQEYDGEWRVIVVDDESEDGTGDVAATIARRFSARQVEVVHGAPRPEGWAGKVWAMEQGLRRAREWAPEFLLFTDADIAHPRDGLARLVAFAERNRRDLVSVMVRLRAASFWERLLIPPFVYFFAKLYPFPWVGDDRRPTAAAAGGCLLVRRIHLEAAGGMAAIAGEVIDDCALARVVKGHGSRLWLGVSDEWRSVRGYEGLGGIRRMVVRSAYAQLRYSPLALAFTVVAMTWTYLVPPLALLVAVRRRWRLVAILGGSAWALMAASFLPTLRWFRLWPLRALLLPVAATQYTYFTVESALRWHMARPVTWRGRGLLGPRPRPAGGSEALGGGT